MDAKQRFINQLLKIRINMNLEPIEKFYADPDMITADMIEVGELNYPNLMINIPDVIHMEIDLQVVLRRAILQKKFTFVNVLLSMGIDMCKIEPKIMIMCAMQDPPIPTPIPTPIPNQNIYNTSNTSDIDSVEKLIFKLIELKTPIDPDNYACVYIFAATGRLNILQKILQTYSFDEQTITAIVGKVCAIAVQQNHVHILQHFMPADVIETIPDLAFEYFIKAIERTDNIDVVKYFVQAGCSIGQSNYQAVDVARQYERKDMIRYFVSVDPHVVELLTLSEKNLYTL